MERSFKETPGDQRVELICGDGLAVADALQRGASRRDVLRWLVEMGLSWTAGQSILASAASPTAQKPKRGGTLRVAMHAGGPTESLDPAKQAISVDYPRARTFFNALTRINASGQAEPELAASFEHSADGREWIFRLRKGVQFHDGKTLTSQDVVYSLMRHKDPATASVVKLLMDPVESIIADGPDVVRIKLSVPNADFPLILGNTSFVIVKSGATDFFHPVGTGPYTLVGMFVPGSRTIGKRFANYFMNGRPYLDELQIFTIGDRNARSNALLAGDIDVATNLSAGTLEQLTTRPDFKVLNTKSGTFVQFAMMCDRAPASNQDFRLAMKNLLDRDRFLKTAQKGFGQLANDHPVPPNHPLYNYELPQRGVDLDKAAFHLRKAGMSGGRVELSVSDAVPGTVEMAQIFQVSAARAGFTIDIKREPADGYYSNVWMKKPFGSNRWVPRPTLDMVLSLGWMSGSKWNDTAYKDPALDTLIVQARGELDMAKRKQMYGEIQKIIYDKGGNAIFGFSDFMDAMSKKVNGIEPNPLAELGGYYFPDTAWFAS